MKELRGIRIFLAVIFLAAAVAYLFIGRQVHPMAVISEKTQIIPSLLGATMGVTAIWLGLTFVFGRIYCATVCPVGTLLDAVSHLGQWAGRRWRPLRRWARPHRWHNEQVWRYPLLGAYAVAVIVPVVAVPLAIEPWNIMRNMATPFHHHLAAGWVELGLGVGTGIFAGAVSFVTLTLLALYTGRFFCNSLCPLGTALGLTRGHTVFHIEIDPDKCISCMKCEDVCKSDCVSVKNREVDNSRCVRCFDCLSVCPNDAIRYQLHRNLRPSSPMMQKV